MWGEVEDGAEVVVGFDVHGLREADVRADGGAEEVEDPEGGDYAEVEFSVYRLRISYLRRRACILSRGGAFFTYKSD